MTLESILIDRIFRAVAAKSVCAMEELVSLVPDLTWNQVFIEVNRLSESGKVILALDDEGAFTVRANNRPADVSPENDGRIKLE